MTGAVSDPSRADGVGQQRPDAEAATAAEIKPIVRANVSKEAKLMTAEARSSSAA